MKKHPCIMEMREHIAEEFPGLKIERYRHRPGTYILKIKGRSVEAAARAARALSDYGFVWTTKAKSVIVRPVFFEENRHYVEASERTAKRHEDALRKLRNWCAKHGVDKDPPDHILQLVADTQAAANRVYVREEERMGRLCVD